MAEKLRIFIDYWNLQLNWNQRMGHDVRLDWEKLPISLKAAAESAAGLPSHQYEGTRLYASHDPTNVKQSKFKPWIDSYLDRLPGYIVILKERRSKKKPVHCRNCGNKIEKCPECKQEYSHSVEKGVDGAIITDLFSFAWDEAYQTAVLVSSDSDFIPAVEKIQDRGIKVINATWKGSGRHLAKAAWASFFIDSLTDQITRPDSGT